MSTTSARGARARLAVKAAIAALVAVVTATTSAGCGRGRPPAAEDGTAAPDRPASGGGFGSDDAGATLPGCEDHNFCDCVDVPLFVDPPNLYFVLDRSGSMAESDKWGRVRVVMASILRGLGPRANFGAMVFPGYEHDTCAPPREILSIRPGDPPGADGPTTRGLLEATRTAPYGGTPTAAALREVLPKLRAAEGKSFVILATDGGPNCNTSLACTSDGCIPNIENVPGCPRDGSPNCCMPPEGYLEACLDAAATKAAAAALNAAGFPVYVIGIPGSATYATLLDEVAVAGGTALPGTPRHYRVGTTSEADILAALKRVAAKIVATCELSLREPPAAPERVNVYLDGQVLPKDPVDGWSLDGADVTLHGAACDRVLAGDVLDVRIIAGCPTVDPR